MLKPFLHDIVRCPTLTTDWFRLVSAAFGRQDLPNWSQLDSGRVIPFYQGRVALWHLCKLWQLREGDEILMPAYNCGTEVDPFLAYGAQVRLYRVDENACIDYDDVKNRCTARTKIFYITHYFGWPQAVKEIYQWCNQRGIHVLEDCAMSLFSYSDEGQLGTLADAAIFSFRKFLPVPDGAALTIKKPVDGNTILSCPPPAIQTIRNLFPFAKSTVLSLLDKARCYSFLRRRKLQSCSFEMQQNDSAQGLKPDMPADYYFDKRIQNWSISKISLDILCRTDPETVINRRRDNYLCLVEMIKKIPRVKLLFNNLDTGVCPLGLVVLVSPRSAIARSLNAFGIAAFPWWEGYHKDCDWHDFPESRFLKDNALYLPINQTMGQRQMEYIGHCIEYICRHRSVP